MQFQFIVVSVPLTKYSHEKHFIWVCIHCLPFSLPTYFLTPLISDFSSLPWHNKLQRINTFLPPGSSMREQEVEFKKSRNIRKLWKSKQQKMHWRSINATHILNRKIKHSQSGNPRINCSHFKTKVRCMLHPR